MIEDSKVINHTREECVHGAWNDKLSWFNMSGKLAWPHLVVFCQSIDLCSASLAFNSWTVPSTSFSIYGLK